jgi:hypothetical protein
MSSPFSVKFLSKNPIALTDSQDANLNEGLKEAIREKEDAPIKMEAESPLEASRYVSIQPSLQRLQSQAMAIQQSVDGSESSELEKSKVNYYEALAENARKDRKDRKDREEDKNNTSTNSNKNTIKIEDDYFKKKYG